MRPVFSGCPSLHWRIPVSVCECGCGLPTKLAPQTDSAKGWIKGQPKRFLLGHQGRRQWAKSTVKGYRYATGRKRQTLHRRRAELVLGKPLPRGAEVHHADGSKNDDAPLVICQDRSYHSLLHKLMRVLRAGGKPHSERICSACRRILPFSAFSGDVLHKNSNHGDRCIACSRESARKSRQRPEAL